MSVIPLTSTQRVGYEAYLFLKGASWELAHVRKKGDPHHRRALDYISRSVTILNGLEGRIVWTRNLECIQYAMPYVTRMWYAIREGDIRKAKSACDKAVACLGEIVTLHYGW